MPISHWFNLSSIRDHFKAHALFNIPQSFIEHNDPLLTTKSILHVFVCTSKFGLFASTQLHLNSKHGLKFQSFVWTVFKEFWKFWMFYDYLFYCNVYISKSIYLLAKDYYFKKMLFCVMVLPATRICCCLFFSLTT